MLYKMKTIIAGSRNLNITPLEFNKQIKQLINTNCLHISEVLSGCSGIIDSLGEAYAINNNIEVLKFPADWSTYGRAAGPIRNQQMVNKADALLLIWDGKSPGSKDVLNKAKKHNLKIYEVII